jgi:hypothetical protein
MSIINNLVITGNSFSGHKSKPGYRDKHGEFLSADDKSRFKATWSRTSFNRSDVNSGKYSLVGSDLVINPDLANLIEISKQLAKVNGYIFGGAVASAIINDFENAKDIDVFFCDKFDFDNLPDIIGVGDNFWDVCVDEKKSYIDDPHKVKHIAYMPYGSNTIQKPLSMNKLIWYKDVHQIPRSFDFTCVKTGLVGNELIYNPCCMKDLLEKKIVITGSLYTGAVLRRVVKYAKRGFTFEDGFTLEQMVNYINDKKENINTVAKAVEPVLEIDYASSDKDAMARYCGYQSWHEYQRAQGEVSI